MFRQHLRRTIISTLIGMAIALFAAFVLPKLYVGKADILLSAAPPNKSRLPSQDEVREILDEGKPKDTVTEVGILRSQGLFSEAALRVSSRILGTALSLDELDGLYSSYEVLATDSSSSISVVVKAGSPELAAGIANEIPVVYGEVRDRSAKESVAKASSFLDSQVKQSGDRVLALQQELRAYKEKNKISDLALDTAQMVSRGVKVRA